MNTMDLERELAEGKIRPIYLVFGEERYLVDVAVRALRKAVLEGAIADFNEDVFTAGEQDVDRVLSAVRTVPMMAPRRLVMVRGIERWEARSGEEQPTSKVSALDRLADYAASPIDSACLVLSGGKIDGRRRVVTLARKEGWLVACDPLDDASLAQWVERAVTRRGARIEGRVARLLAQIAGPDLGHVADAVERLCLYVGEGQLIGEDAVSDVVVKVRETSVFALVDAVSRRDRNRALSALSEVYDPRDRGLPLLGLLAWSVRQLLKFTLATRAGAKPDEAARAAGAPPFKARDLAQQTRTLTPEQLERWLTLLAEADLALKGSKRAPDAVLATLVLDMAR
jgi:DNA polymerase III subunit delta